MGHHVHGHEPWSMSMTMALAMAIARAMAVIRPEHAERAQIYENSLFITKRVLLLFRLISDRLDFENGSGSKFYTRK